MDLLTAPCWKPGMLRDVKSNHKCERPRIIQHQKTVSFYHFSGSNTETTSLIAFCRHILAISRRTNCPRTNHPFPTPSIYSLLASLDWFFYLFWYSCPRYYQSQSYTWCWSCHESTYYRIVRWTNPRPSCFSQGCWFFGLCSTWVRVRCSLPKFGCFE
jgi:hypothetical protein